MNEQYNIPKENSLNPFILFRFGKTEHIQEFIKSGHIYMNSINYFRSIENDNERHDTNENITGFHQHNDITITINGRQIKDFAEPITRYFSCEDSYKISHIFCMSHLSTETPVRNDMKIFDDRIKKFGEAIAVIYNIPEFNSRLRSKLSDLIDKKNITSAYSRSVRYIDPSTYSGHMDVFTKTNDYNHQQEFRIGIKKCTSDFNKPFEFNIGSISDIAQIVKIQDFKNLIQIDKNGHHKILVTDSN